MTEKSAAELEREAETARARVVGTAESLRNKMTPGQLIDEVTGMFSGGDGSAALRNLKAQMRDNPLPLTMVGAGLAWLMLGNGQSSHQASRSGGMHEEWEGGKQSFASSDFGSSSQGYDRTEEDEHGESMGERLSGMTDSAQAMAGDAADTVRQTFAGARDSFARTAGHARDGFSRTSGGVRRSAETLMQEEPLVLAALGLTLGTAIGVMLPHTSVEDQHMGKYAKKLRDAGEDLYEKGVEEAKSVASEAYDAVKEEADRQGLTGDGDATLAERVSKVVKSAASRTEESVRERTDSKSPL
ncbi:MAG: hypothetical protein H0T56_11630 [Pseudaminobacter sp.]|nr:hypothetical protein [Pseudaminobacter sp.]